MLRTLYLGIVWAYFWLSAYNQKKESKNRRQTSTPEIYVGLFRVGMVGRNRGEIEQNRGEEVAGEKWF